MEGICEIGGAKPPISQIPVGERVAFAIGAPILKIGGGFSPPAIFRIGAPLQNATSDWFLYY